MTSRTERMLLEDAEELGWIGLRAPASGARPGSDAGDLWLGRLRVIQHEWGGDAETVTELLIVEEKYKSNEHNKYIQEKGDKLDSMIELAEKMGARPVLAVRWSTRVEWSPGATHYMIDARDIERTASGNISVKPETALEKFDPVDDFLS